MSESLRVRFLCAAIFCSAVVFGVICDLRSQPGIFDRYYFAGLVGWAVAGFFFQRALQGGAA